MLRVTKKKQWEINKDNIEGIYKDQAKKIKSSFEWNAIWSYMDRLIKMQIEKPHLQKALKLNNHLYTEYRKNILREINNAHT